MKRLKQWFLLRFIYRFYYTNGLYKIYGVMGKKYLYGIVVRSPNYVLKEWSFVRTYKYHLETDTKPQWQLVNKIK
jgi:hypothetical protein